MDQFQPGSPAYNIPLAVRASGSLDAGVLQRVLDEIVRRHEALRTTFAAVDGRPVQVIAPQLALPLGHIDLSGLPQGQREVEVRRLAQEEACRPFDLARGPLLRATLLRLGAEEQIIQLTMHHIVSDGWSMGVLVGEVAALYGALAAGRPSPLAELPIQYADFAQWQRERLQGRLLEEQLGYWKAQLGGEPAVLELPGSRPRPAVPSGRGATLSVSLPWQLADGLAALAGQEGATPFMALLAGFQALLARYTGQEDVCVGSPIANRNRSEIEGLIGFFVNTLVLRTDLSGQPSFRELVRRVRQVALGAYAHQDLPFEMLVDALQPARDMSHSSLFQVMFIVQNAPVQGWELPGLALRRLEVDSGTATFDLTLSVAEGEEGLDVSAEYSSDLFDAADIARLLAHYRALLEGAVAAPERPLGELELLTAAEQRQLVVWNDSALPVAVDVAACIAAQPAEALAVVCPETGEQLTYGALDRQAGRLAGRLRALGVGPDDVVGICLERSAALIAAVVGVLRSGGAYLPLDPGYPQERLAAMLADAAPRVLVSERGLEGVLPAHGSPVVWLDEDELADVAVEPPVAVDPERLAYIIYTSGSTGVPKGVMVTRGGLGNAYAAWARAYGLEGWPGRHLQMANFSFDVFTGDLVRALCSGGRLVLCPREWLLEPERLYGLMVGEGIDCAEFVPAVLRPLAAWCEAEGKDLSFMRLLVCGSESWTVWEYARLQRLCGPETRLINSYGLTEVTIDSTYFEGDVAHLSAEGCVPIGRPFGNTELRILDSHGRAVPVGVAGELYIGGPGLARGYRNRAELTAERFVGGHPVGGVGRLYRTGDLARWLPDGNVEYLGRADGQVKVRGYRIEVGEVEAALRGLGGVRDVAVVAKEERSGERRLVAYVVGERRGAGEVRRELQARLPEYMVPGVYVWLEALPLMPNGKVDRGALPAPDWSERQAEAPYVAPRTAAEEVLAGIWCEVLGVERVGVHDSFFELGGHSLLATQVVSRVRQALQVELPLRSLFEAPTVAGLAQRLELPDAAATARPAPPLRPVPRQGELPLSFAQQRLWFLDQLEP
ncbi:MAG TPA: amino acid adenylation domain-containing protein, partial [Anaerolineae bacterium]|nr:amino acid adenylation domain-containing protein [Anaerolineae bacterium]HOR01592.1 amino acid adenylation domain-containing protein [Anaerolineae bacterium]HPL30315.1 amino acid adenylation domain-containing protein [Anaerolineae bacterium]